MAGLQVRSIGIIGGGAWGLTLANLLTDNGFQVVVWDRNGERIKKLRILRRDDRRLPGIRLNNEIDFTNDLNLLKDKDLHILAVKSEAVPDVVKMLKGINVKVIISTIKGFVGDGVNLVSSYLKETLPKSEVIVLSGPSIALEVCNKKPTSVVVAGDNEDTLIEIQRVFSNGYFRVYRQDDVIGVEMCGALKNVLAIASGICDGLGLGENSKGALLTRGLYEMMRFGMSFGAKRETFFGLAGIGDIITTSFSKNSRNRYVGEMLGKGETIQEILSKMVMVAEGVRTAFIVRDEADRMGIDMPITKAVCEVIEGKVSPYDAIEKLMRRELKREFYV